MRIIVIFFLTIYNASATYIDEVPNYNTSPAWTKFLSDWHNSEEYKVEAKILKQRKVHPKVGVGFNIQRCNKGVGFTACDFTMCIMASKKEFSKTWIALADEYSKKKCENKSVENELTREIEYVRSKYRDCLKTRKSKKDFRCKTSGE